MKALKKISVAYALQVFAVIILFGYALSSSGNGKKETKNNNYMMPSGINKQLLVRANKDSLLTQKINTWRRYTGKGW
jgi:hypothetical protein